MEYMKNTIFLFLLFFNFTLKAQEKTNNKYLSDFDFFIEKLIETHPDPFTKFGNKVEFYRKKQSLRKEILKISTDDEFIAKLNEFISNIEDGHTYIFASHKKVNRKYLPLKLKVSKNHLFIQNSDKEFDMYIGSRIFSINGISIDKLLKEVKKHYPSENISGAYSDLIKVLKYSDLAEKIFGEKDTLEFQIASYKVLEKIKIPYKERVDFIKTKSKITFEKDNGLLFWEMIGKNKNIGYLKWNSVLSREIVEYKQKKNSNNLKNTLAWAYSYLKAKRTNNTTKDIQQIPALYEEFYLLLEKMRAKKSKHLIIDLRYNGGGMTPLVRPILYMLYGDKYLNYKFNNEYITKISPLYLNKIGFKNIDEYNKIYKLNYQMGDCIFSKFSIFSEDQTISEKKEIVRNAYQGFGSDFIKKNEKKSQYSPQIIVLTSPTTFSAAYHFTYFLKKIGKAKIIGIASKQAGNAFMEVTRLQLPNTKLRCSISNSKQVLFKDNEKLGKLLTPDYEMKWSDFKKFNFDNNSEILKTFKLIEKQKL